MPGVDKVIGERYAFRQDAQRRLLSVSVEQAMQNSGLKSIPGRQEWAGVFDEFPKEINWPEVSRVKDTS